MDAQDLLRVGVLFADRDGMDTWWLSLLEVTLSILAFVFLVGLAVFYLHYWDSAIGFFYCWILACLNIPFIVSGIRHLLKG